MLGTIRIAAIAAVALLLTAGLPAVQGAEAPVVLLGIDANGAAELAKTGQNAPLASFWVGDWIADSGWGGVENMLKTSKASGRTPVLYWYYWGDSISPSCVDNGCNGRNRTEWDALTTGLATRIRDIMGGSPTYVVLENEFNKGGITDSSYAPTFDRYLEEKAIELKGVSGVKVVLGYGSWGESNWNRFPRAIAASDAIGFQIMRANTRDTETFYRASDDKIASVLAFIQTLAPGKGALLYDLALSSYPDSNWVTAQKETLEEILARRAEYGANGLMGIVYRTVRDNPNMSPANYYGYAEQHWGLKKSDGTAKPSLAVWTNAFSTVAPAPAPAPTPAPAPQLPASFEGESMVATKGGRATDATASGGALWNLWSNGEVSQRVNSSGGTYRIDIKARGPAAGGVAPIMVLKVDNINIRSWSVASTLSTYTADVAFPAGESKLAVAFTNDAVIGTEDRNLLVDIVVVAQAPVNRAPLAAFESSGAQLTWSFDARGSSDPDGDALSYSWSFGASGAVVTHDFPAGDHGVTLTVADPSGSTASLTRTIAATQPNQAPTASIVASGSVDTWTFDARGSTDPDGDALVYAWSFGGSEPVATRTFAPGEHTVTLTVTDPSGAWASASRTFTATQRNRAPTATIVASGAVDTWTFDARGSTDPDGDALVYAWSFGGSEAVATRTFAPGEHTVTLTVTDPSGAWASASRTFTATQRNRAPTASIVASGVNDTWAFDASSSSDPDGDALSYSWTFPDGTSATGVRVTRTFAAGVQTVQLVVSDPAGLTGGASASVTSVKPAPVAFAATFSGVKGNDYWVEVKVSANKALTGVCASVDGGACQALVSKSWGAWAASFYVKPGSDIKFRASAGTESITSGAYDWPSGTPVTATPAVKFTPYDGNANWVQTKVESTATVKAVCASLNGGVCKALTYRSWGAWAVGLYAPTGTKVVFTATLADGTQVKSTVYTWPVK